MRLAVLAGVLLLLAGCTSGTTCAEASCVAGIQLDDRFYASTGQKADRSTLGRKIATVVDYARCSVGCDGDAPPDPGPGEALGGSIGAEVYAVHGYRTSFRVATLERGKAALHENHGGPRDRVGRDMLDLAGKVERITSQQTGNRATGKQLAITDPRRIAWIIGAIDSSPIGEPKEFYEHFYVTFHLRDGTATTLGFAPRARALDDRLLIPVGVVRALTPP